MTQHLIKLLDRTQSVGKRQHAFAVAFVAARAAFALPEAVLFSKLTPEGNIRCFFCIQQQLITALAHCSDTQWCARPYVTHVLVDDNKVDEATGIMKPPAYRSIYLSLY